MKQKNKNSYEEVLKSEVAKLKEENRHLNDENKELKYMLNDMHSVVDAANDDFFNEMSRLCGCIEIEGTRITSAYQDLVGILLANDLNYVVDKIRNYYELGNYKSDDEMNAADQAVASDLEKPDSKGRRTRGKKAEPATPTTAPEEKTGRTRKSRAEVQAENEQKIADHMDEVDKAIDQAFPGQEEVPFDEAMDVADKVSKPDLQKPPRRTRKERNAEKSETVQDGTTNTDSESVTLDADTYFYVPADDNYVMKHKGDTVDLIVDGVEVMKVITREEFNAGIKRLAQENNPVPADAQTPAEPLDGAMNPPEQHVRGQRRRRTRS